MRGALIQLLRTAPQRSSVLRLPVTVGTMRYDERHADQLHGISPKASLSYGFVADQLFWLRFMRLDGVTKVCIELRPLIIGRESAQRVRDFFLAHGFQENPAASDEEHILYDRD